ncbi:acyl-CoA dehydrogenase [Phytomonospora sp. NPDC050363]|uniref:acyl-CoA dehydrogenase n=1 Tax=Phytomonospora sp. NPDC050363 TaxID=3155642 RepID=UPI0033EAC0CB
MPIDSVWRIFDNELFEQRPGLTAAERHRLTYERLRHVNAAIGSGAALLIDRARMNALFAAAAVVDPVLFHAMILHYPLCLGFVTDLGAGNPETADCLSRLEKMDSVGVLLLTEAGRSGSHLATATEAIYDHDGRRFILHTPEPAAAKFPAAADSATPKTAVVFARLRVDGRDGGVFPFHLDVRTDEGVRAGVAIEPTEEATGLPHDYATVTFDHVPVPYGHWLRGEAAIDEHGTFTDPEGSIAGRLRRSLAMSRPVWRAIVAASAGISRAAVTMALRYSYRRTTAGPLAPDSPVIAFRNQQLALFAALADSVALTVITERFEQPDIAAARTGDTGMGWAPWSAVDLELPLLKATAVDTALNLVGTCRARCGAMASVATNRYTAYHGLLDAYVSAGGDNQLILLDTARTMIADGDHPAPDTADVDITEPQGWLLLATATENRLRTSLAAGLNAARGRGEDEFTAWNDHLDLALRAATAYADRVVLQAFTDAVQAADPADREGMSRLAAFHACTWIDRRAGEILRTGAGTPDQVKAAGHARLRLADALVETALATVDAFAIPPRHLSPILAGEGDYLEILLGGRRTAAPAPPA